MCMLRFRTVIIGGSGGGVDFNVKISKIDLIVLVVTHDIECFQVQA